MPSVLITGTSTGIGAAAALTFARRGLKTFATMRNLTRAGALEAARDAEHLDIDIRALDVTDADSVSSCIGEILRGNDLDVLVNNAGVAGATPLELVPLDKHKAMFEANYFGAIRAIQAVLPHMRERGSGTIVNISSVAGRVAVPNQVPYSASKWALECASEALAHEVARFGVRVRIIEPGVIMTKIFENAAEHTVYDKRSPYIDLMRRNGKFYAAGFEVGSPAQAVADVICDAALSDSDQLRYVVGDDATGWIEGRAAMSDEQWVAMGDGLTDADYNAQFFQRFGIQLK